MNNKQKRILNLLVVSVLIGVGEYVTYHIHINLFILVTIVVIGVITSVIIPSYLPDQERVVDI